jgi:hypothetical protein
VFNGGRESGAVWVNELRDFVAGLCEAEYSTDEQLAQAVQLTLVTPAVRAAVINKLLNEDVKKSLRASLYHHIGSGLATWQQISSFVTESFPGELPEEATEALQDLKQQPGEKVEVYSRRFRYLASISGGSCYTEQGKAKRFVDSLCYPTVQHEVRRLMNLAAMEGQPWTLQRTIREAIHQEAAIKPQATTLPPQQQQQHKSHRGGWRRNYGGRSWGSGSGSGSGGSSNSGSQGASSSSGSSINNPTIMAPVQPSGQFKGSCAACGKEGHRFADNPDCLAAWQALPGKEKNARRQQHGMPINHVRFQGEGGSPSAGR